MRIIAGSLGGRRFFAPNGHSTHPMSEKARGALFNMLGDLTGLTVLDAFAGSGALSYESISRGAASVLAIELDKTAQATIIRNLHELNLQDRIDLIHGNCAAWSSRNKDKQYDIVICDPPYDRIQIGTIEKLAVHVKNGGLLVLSWPRHLSTEQLKGLTILKVGGYGDAQLVFYRKTLLK